MKEIKNNRQFQETHRRMMNTLVSYLQERPLNKITVTEICTSLSVNRSTFYEHFTDIYDLMEQTETEFSKEGAACFADGLKHSRKDAFINFFRYVKEQRTFYAVYLGQGKTIHFSDKLLGEGMEKRRKNMAALRWGNMPAHEPYHMEFFRAGMNAVIRHWVEGGCTESPAELYDILIEEYMPWRE